MFLIATSDLVVQSVSLTLQLQCARVTERIEVLFWVDTLSDPRNIVLDGGLDLLMARRGV